MPTVEITEPVELPALCEITVIQSAEGVKYGTWSAPCWKAFQAYEVVSEANVEIAAANASALRNTEAGYQSAISAGQMQQELTFFYADLLEEERSARFIDGLLFKSIIGLGLLVAIP